MSTVGGSGGNGGDGGGKNDDRRPPLPDPKRRKRARVRFVRPGEGNDDSQEEDEDAPLNVARDGSSGSIFNRVMIPPDWIELELLDDYGEGIANAPYEILEVFFETVVKQGTLDALGRTYIYPIPRGLYRVRFPGIDRGDIIETWDLQYPSPVLYGSQQRDWCEITLVDEYDRPLPRVDYRAVFADGRAITGQTDERGTARFLWIASGNVTVTFPRLDAGDVYAADDAGWDDEEEEL